MPKYILHFGATLENLPLIRHFVQERLQPYLPDSIQLNQVTVAVEELCSNSILHANKEDPTKQLRLELHIRKKAIHIYLHDPAPPYDIHSYPPEPQLLRKGTLRPGGFGIYLMRKFVDQIHVRKGKKEGSIYHMIKEIS